MIKNLIQENRFEELKQKLNNPDSELKIHQLVFRILNNEHIEDDNNFIEASRYQEEFLEGLELYKAFYKSAMPEAQFKEYTFVLVHLVYKMGEFIKLLANTAMNKGVYLADFENIYKVNPEIRNELQLFITLLKDKNEIKAIANVAAAKAQISNSIPSLLKKHEIGEDMLQFAQSYEAVGQTEVAVKIYSGIMNDFECESIRLSSGLFPEISQFDTRSKEEIAVFEKAKYHYENLTEENIPDIPKVKIDNDNNAKEIFDESHSREKSAIAEVTEAQNTGFFNRIIKFLRK